MPMNLSEKSLCPRFRNSGKPILLTFFLATLALSSCEVFNRDEEIPVYLKINQPTVVIDSAIGLTSQLGIRDIWLTQGENIQGIYPSPTVIPVMKSAGNALRLDAGIYETGQSAYRIPYPFLHPVYFTVDAEAGDTVELNPVLTYLGDAEIDIRIDERFENSDINFRPFVISGSDTTNVRKSTEDVFRGSFSGKVRFDATHKYWSTIHNSPDPMQIAKNKDVYAEITYKNDIPFTVGLAYKSLSAGENGTIPVVTLNPSDEWNTVYVHFVEQIRGLSVPDAAFHLWLSADGDGETGEIYLDNIRLIHFQ